MNIGYNRIVEKPAFVKCSAIILLIPGMSVNSGFVVRLPSLSPYSPIHSFFTRPRYLYHFAGMINLFAFWAFVFGIPAFVPITRSKLRLVAFRTNDTLWLDKSDSDIIRKVCICSHYSLLNDRHIAAAYYGVQILSLSSASGGCVAFHGIYLRIYAVIIRDKSGFSLNFNPHARAGRDSFVGYSFVTCIYFNHAPGTLILIAGLKMYSSLCGRVIYNSNFGKRFFKLPDYLFEPLRNCTGICDFATLRTLGTWDVFYYNNTTADLSEMRGMIRLHCTFTKETSHYTCGSFLILKLLSHSSVFGKYAVISHNLLFPTPHTACKNAFFTDKPSTRQLGKG